VNPVLSSQVSAGHCSLSVSVGQTAFHFYIAEMTEHLMELRRANRPEVVTH